MILTILIFLIILAVLIFVHELGHFLAAKTFGIRVDEFALGFPPKIWSKKIGETEYALNAIPFGGYVKIFGESGEVGERSFTNTLRWKKIIVLIAGVTMNIIFGWILLSGGYMIGLPANADVSSAHMSNIALTVTDVLAASPAEKAGLASGDIILKVSDGNKIVNNPTADELSTFIAQSSGPISVTYESTSHQTNTVTLTPVTGIVSGSLGIGIGMDMIGTLRLPFGQAIMQGGKDTLIFLDTIVVGLWQFIVGLIHPSTTAQALSQVSGPVGIAKVVGQARTIGFAYLLSLVAFISLNLAVINLLPIPALDGGRVVITIIEGLRRKPISPKTLQKVINTSFMVLLALILIVTLHDIYTIL